ncbi:MAG: hypothetical protein FD126_2849, partial [Elusimicrobia bacterium]
MSRTATVGPDGTLPPADFEA